VFRFHSIFTSVNPASMKAIIPLLCLTLLPAFADLPVSGRPVPAMTAFDDAMQDIMDEHDVTAGVLGIMRNDRIIYLRAFGYQDIFPSLVPLPENALFRIASVSKPVTAAAIRHLADSGALGQQGLQRRVFLHLTNNGLLNIPAWNQLGDSRLADITVEHLLHHSGGFRRDLIPGDPMFQSREIADVMGVDSPASRYNIIRYMLQFPLWSDPGTVDVNDNGETYSNFGYMVLGEIVENYGGSSYITYLRNHVLTPDMWVPSTEFARGRSLLHNRHPREPLYAGTTQVDSVFDEFPGSVPRQYGGFDIEAMLAHGGIIASAQAMLAFGNDYEVWVPDIGSRVVTPTSHSGGAHTGALEGTSTALAPDNDTDGTVIYVAFNKRKGKNGDELEGIARTAVRDLINAGSFTWPTETCDGFWVSAGSGGGDPGKGGYHAPYRGFANAIAETSAGSRIRLKPGNNAWSGKLDRKMRLDAPEGAARIGVP
jgi:CubicO group peptidase (beta-lactamase class C family)